MFTPNTKMMSVTFNIEPDEYVDSAILCWSPTLKCDVWLATDDLLETYDMETTEDEPKAYSGSQPINQDWAILTNKNGDKNQIFWTCASQFTCESLEDMAFTNNNGLDIDVSHISFEYNDVISYSDTETYWDVGVVDDADEGKVTLYSAVESNDPTSEDDDGDDVYSQIPQEKFEAIRQLFIQAGFKVKMKRYPRER